MRGEVKDAGVDQHQEDETNESIWGGHTQTLEAYINTSTFGPPLLYYSMRCNENNNNNYCPPPIIEEGRQNSVKINKIGKQCWPR